MLAAGEHPVNQVIADLNHLEDRENIRIESAVFNRTAYR
jgi:hypothetical protein